jgi:hypothetical protein
MLRIPSKGLPLYACLFTSALLAAVSFRLNSPAGTTTHAQIIAPSYTATPSRSWEVVAASTSSGTTAAPIDDTFAHISALLRSGSAGDAASMQALETLASNPAAALASGQRLMREFPDRAGEIGTILVGALVRGSHHTEALQLVQCGPESSRAEWLEIILSHWARTEPDAGKLIVDQLHQNAVSAATFEMVAKNWSASAPEDLARYALMLPPGEHRAIALSSALEPWLLQNPSAVASYLQQLTEPAERDLYAAALASQTDTALRPTSQGLNWAEMITDPELRRTALGRIVREWAATDPVEASRYLSRSPDFNGDQRQALIASLAPAPEAF